MGKERKEECRDSTATGIRVWRSNDAEAHRNKQLSGKRETSQVCHTSLPTQHGTESPAYLCRRALEMQRKTTSSVEILARSVINKWRARNSSDHGAGNRRCRAARAEDREKESTQGSALHVEAVRRNDNPEVAKSSNGAPQTPGERGHDLRALVDDN